MKKIFGIALVLALVTSLCFGTVALADDGDGILADIDSSDDAGLGGEINVTWDGTGWVGGYVSSGDDAETWFNTACDGSFIKGSFTASKTVNTAYPYMGVDTYSSYINAEVEDGFIEFETHRNDSYGGYGPAGQESYSYLEVYGSSGAMAVGSCTNFAAMKDCTYGHQLPGGHNFVVTDADHYYINRWIYDGGGNGAGLEVGGSGSATLDCMSCEASGNGGIRLGWGCGCYTDANFHATTGSGYFRCGGDGHSSITFNGMGMSVSGNDVSLGFIAEWVNGTCDIADYSLTIN